MTEDLAAALRHHRAGRLDEAEKIYRRIIDEQPEQPEILHLLGGIAYQKGDPNTALAFYDRAGAASMGPQSDTLAFNRGNALKVLGRREEAIAAFQAATEAAPENPAAFYNLGLLYQQGQCFEEAESAYRRAIEVRHDYVAAWNNLGALYHEQGRHDDAESALHQALGHDPDFGDALFNLARLVREQGRVGEAEALLRRYLDQNSDQDQAHRLLGDLLMAQGRTELAIDSYRAAIDLDRNFFDAHVNLGAAYSELDRVEEAEAAFRHAMALKPDDVLVRRNLASLLQRCGRGAEAVSVYDEALRLAPDSVELRLGRCVAQLPIVPDSAAHLADARSAYASALQSLLDDLSAAPEAVRAEAALAIGTAQPFYLAYQGHDDRALQTAYGTLCTSLMAARHPDLVQSLPLRLRHPEDPIRVGFVSGFFSWHSVWTIPLRGWLDQLDRSRFTVYAYQTRSVHDAATDAAIALADHFVGGLLTVAEWADRVRSDALDVLIYPEIGMDPTSVRLASLRLAPVQCASFGHPQTTGLATIDYFLSGDFMEPSNGQDHYTETLERLPNLGLWYTPPAEDRAMATREDFGLPGDAVLYWCCQSLYKYLPQYDRLFVEIAQRVPSAHFAFLQAPFSAITEAFKSRLRRAFTAAGLDMDQCCTFLRRLTVGEFGAMAANSDVYLDSVGWSGFNTVLESLHWGIPVVTCPTDLMRGRHTHGVLSAMGVTETIADSPDDFVRLAVELGQDSAKRAALFGQILNARDAVYRDRKAIEGLEAFLERVAPPAMPSAERDTGTDTDAEPLSAPATPAVTVIPIEVGPAMAAETGVDGSPSLGSDRSDLSASALADVPVSSDQSAQSTEGPGAPGSLEVLASEEGNRN